MATLEQQALQELLDRLGPLERRVLLEALEQQDSKVQRGLRLPQLMVDLHPLSVD